MAGLVLFVLYLLLYLLPPRTVKYLQYVQYLQRLIFERDFDGFLLEVFYPLEKKISSSLYV
jgi:hypothetical protein